MAEVLAHQKEPIKVLERPPRWDSKERALVEVNQEIPDRDEAELRLAVQGGEPSAAS
jgi:hypothetical protein